MLSAQAGTAALSVAVMYLTVDAITGVTPDADGAMKLKAVADLTCAPAFAILSSSSATSKQLIDQARAVISALSGLGT